MNKKADSSEDLDTLEAFDFYPFATFVPGEGYHRWKTIQIAKGRISTRVNIHSRDYRPTVLATCKLFTYDETADDGVGAWVELDFATGQPVE